MEMIWIKTEEMLENLRNEPGVEQQYALSLGGILRSTHWLIYDAERGLYGDSMDWEEYAWYTREEFLEVRGGQLVVPGALNRMK